jgi:hypothetical protein
MFGIGRRRQQSSVFSARTGVISAVALGAALVAKKLWNKKKEAGGVGLREAYSKSSEWTPETTTP